MASANHAPREAALGNRGNEVQPGKDGAVRAEKRARKDGEETKMMVLVMCDY